MISLQNWLRIFFSADTDKKFPDVDICPEVVDVDSDVFSQKILTTLWKKVPPHSDLKLVTIIIYYSNDIGLYYETSVCTVPYDLS